MNRLANVFLRWFGMLIYATGLHGIIIWFHRKDPKVLAFHACEPSESDALRGLGANTTPSEFAAHIDFLRRHYNVVPLSALVKGTYPERAVVITFDDGYRSVYENAFPLLQRHGMTATVYVVTAVVDNSSMVWVNELNWLLHHHPEVAIPRASQVLCKSERAHPSVIIDRAVQRYDPKVIQPLIAELRLEVGVNPDALSRDLRLYVTWDELDEMASRGVTIGNHTVTHPNLPRLSEQEQREEIVSAWHQIREHAGTVPSLAVPFGYYDSVSEAIATECGASSVMMLTGVNRPLDLRRVARVQVGAGGPATLFSMMEVVEPVKTTLARWLGVRRDAGVPTT